MPDEFDEFEMRTEAESPLGSTDPDPGRRGPGRDRLFPLLLAGAAVVVVAGVSALLFLLRPSRTAAPPPPAPSLAPTPRQTAEPRVTLPPLDDSDGYARAIARGLSAHPELARWLARTGLVRTLTVVVSNIADGETPRPHLEFLAPAQRFRARAGRRGTILPDPAGFAGYDRFADVVSTIDAAAAVSAYRKCEPLFDAAYKDLGHPEGFRPALDRAIAALLAVPVPPADAPLVPHAIGFRWADPELEGLSAAQKQFLRIGPRNVALVQGELRKLQAALASAGAAPPAAPSPEVPQPETAPSGARERV
jgi:hypothetical protein